MRPTVAATFCALVISILVVSIFGVGATSTSAQEVPKPNFVFILADDMRADDLRYMPKTNALLAEQGMRFENAFVSYALCCPSRSTIMRGQYAHNTGVWDHVSGPDGGWEGYQNHGNEQDNVATRLHDAGYRTGLFGKYLNGYYDTTYVPPGWDDWFVKFSRYEWSGKFNYQYYDYDVNDNGAITHFGTDTADYSTDVIGGRAQEFIGASVAEGKPFFAYVAPSAPHGPAIPAQRHLLAFEDEQAPRLPSFNEEDVSDKPPAIQSRQALGPKITARIDTRHEKRVGTLQALDDLVEGVVSQLEAAGALENTYVVFTSDNGWYHGEHRVPKGKSLPYEEGIHMPLLIRGPGVQAGSTTDALTLNTDFLPTFTDLAGIQTPGYVDGRSLRPLLERSAATTATGWRTAILLERRSLHTPGASFYGVRTSEGKKYVEYEDGFRELYDLSDDPYELSNSYDASAPLADLATRLEVLKRCAAETCRAAEDGP